MNRQLQDKNQYELTTVIRNEQCLSQKRNSDFAFPGNSKNSVTLTKQENETEWFYIKIIKNIRFKNIILKIITFGCINDLIETKTNNEIKPWLYKLTIVQQKNNEEMLRTNQLIVKAEEIIKNSEKNCINKQQINNEELFYDALGKQPWLEMKTVTLNNI